MSEKLNFIDNSTIENCNTLENIELMRIESKINRIENDVKMLDEVKQIFEEIRDSGFASWSNAPTLEPVRTYGILDGHDVKEQMTSKFTPSQIHMNIPSPFAEYQSEQEGQASISIRFNSFCEPIIKNVVDAKWGYDEVKIAVIDEKLQMFRKCRHVIPYFNTQTTENIADRTLTENDYITYFDGFLREAIADNIKSPYRSLIHHVPKNIVKK